MKKNKLVIKGNLDIFVIENEAEDADNGKSFTWQNISIHGDPEGVRSFAKLLIKLADINQDEVIDLPNGAREHIHLQPNYDLSKSSNQLIVGRLDAKGTGDFYGRYVSKDLK